MKNKLIALMLASVMAVSMLAGCGNDDVNTTPSETETSKTSETTSVNESTTSEAEGVEELTYPVDSDVKLTFYVRNNLLQLSSAYTDHNEVPFLKALQEKTGFDIEFIEAAVGADANTAFNLMLQDEVLPNIIQGQGFTPTKLLEMYNDGLIVDLTEYLPKYAPDYWEYIHAEGMERELEILEVEGKYLVFPFMPELEGVPYLGPVVRQDWLDEQNLKAPVTMDDWENVLKVFNEKYGAVLAFAINGGRGQHHFIANGTGAKAAFSGRFYLDGDKVICANTEEEWKEFLTYLNRWYDMGLLDPDFATGRDNTTREAALSGKIGLSFTAMSQLTNWINDAEAQGTGADWVGISYPVPEEGDVVEFIQTRRTSYDEKGAVISATSTEEEIIAACQLLNYGFQKDGIMFWNYGEEGVAYTMENGKPVFTDLITKDERGMTEAFKDYIGQHSAGIGVVLKEQTAIKNHPTTVEAQATWVANTDAEKYYMPTLILSDEDNTTYTDTWAAIDTYIQEMALKFVTGDADLAKFDEFINTLNEMGLQKCIDIQQAAYDKWKAEK